MYFSSYKQLHKHFTVSQKLLHFNVANRFLHEKPGIILGIESSCDETGCAIVDSNGTILGEALNSQHQTHLNLGGIVPTIARSIHTKNITGVCEDALKAANLRLRDIDAIATTTKPGLPLSLNVGVSFGKYLAKTGMKPFIPVHHMEAHALTARMMNKIDFPYLVLLVSGAHCFLAIVENISKFYLLGTSINNAPGEIFDKLARRLKLRNIPEFSTLSGGRAVEAAASRATDIDQFLFFPTMTMYRDCNFSFAGLLSRGNNYIISEETKHNIIGDMVIPSAYNLCAAFQLAVTTHICQRTQRAMEFIDKLTLIPKDKRTLVISGGVACNSFLSKALYIVCTELGYNFVRTPPKLCTDNGVMIAWNGVEKWVAGTDVIRDQKDIAKIEAEKDAPFGENWIKRVEEAQLKCEWIKIKRKLYETM